MPRAGIHLVLFTVFFYFAFAIKEESERKGTRGMMIPGGATVPQYILVPGFGRGPSGEEKVRKNEAGLVSLIQ